MLLSELLVLPDETQLSDYVDGEGNSLSMRAHLFAPAIPPIGSTVKDLRDYIAAHPDDNNKAIWLQLEIAPVDASEIEHPEPDVAEPEVDTPPQPTPVIHPEVINEIAKPDKYEIRSRRLIGAMFAMVLAFTILVFTSVVAVVCIDKKELPSATLAGIIILPTMMVTWYYMGIINRERRDILSAVVGDKINSSVIADVVNALRNRR